MAYRGRLQHRLPEAYASAQYGHVPQTIRPYIYVTTNVLTTHLLMLSVCSAHIPCAVSLQPLLPSTSRGYMQQVNAQCCMEWVLQGGMRQSEAIHAEKGLPL